MIIEQNHLDQCRKIDKQARCGRRLAARGTRRARSREEGSRKEDKMEDT